MRARLTAAIGGSVGGPGLTLALSMAMGFTIGPGYILAAVLGGLVAGVAGWYLPGHTERNVQSAVKQATVIALRNTNGARKPQPPGPHTIRWTA